MLRSLPPLVLSLTLAACGGTADGTGSETDTGSGATGAIEGDQTSGAGGGSSGPAAALESCDGVAPTLHTVSVDELAAMLEAKDFLMLNVHVPYAGEIPGTDEHISFLDVDSIEAYLGMNPAQKTVVYCRSGSMSDTAGRQLAQRGYCNVYDLPGGMNAWAAAGNTLLQ